jgi:hypothetical protein
MKTLLNYLIYFLFYLFAIPTGIGMIICCTLKEVSDWLEAKNIRQ